MRTIKEHYSKSSFFLSRLGSTVQVITMLLYRKSEPNEPKMY
jgi:hypothetical protein